MDRDQFRQLVIEQFRLGQDSAHFEDHWLRVEAYGLHLGRLYRADLEVIRLFALLHDSQRFEECYDPEHGPRAARFAELHCGKSFSLEPPQLELLTEACRDHDRGFTHRNATIACCWDADRLDLDRVCIAPDPNYMSTGEGKRLALKRAWDRQKEAGIRIS
ncbi:hypothetical protein JST97_02195 [bacterium]|nr:hypothetical protein [bacterium]